MYDEATGKMVGYDGTKQTNMDNMYTVGDLLHISPELALVATKAGRLHMRILFSMDCINSMDQNGLQLSSHEGFHAFGMRMCWALRRQVHCEIWKGKCRGN